MKSGSKGIRARFAFWSLLDLFKGHHKNLYKFFTICNLQGFFVNLSEILLRTEC